MFVSPLSNLFAQEEIEDNWDNILYYSNKLGWGEDSWRHTVLAQGRFNNNFSTLEQWFLEYAATYLVSERLEIVPDFRLTRKPTRREYRPGFGVIFKNLLPKSQLVHQIKWQYDFKENGVPDSHALRYAVFYNKLLKEKILATFLAGRIYEWGDTFQGFWGMRTGFDVSYIFNHQHRVVVRIGQYQGGAYKVDPCGYPDFYHSHQYQEGFQILAC